MEAKLCIIDTSEDRIKAYVIPKNKQQGTTARKIVWIDRHRFGREISLQAGQVYEVNYGSMFLSVHRLTEESFFEVKKSAIQKVHYSDYVIADTQEAAEAKYTKSLVNKKTRDRTIQRSVCHVDEIEF